LAGSGPAKRAFNRGDLVAWGPDMKPIKLSQLTNSMLMLEPNGGSRFKARRQYRLRLEARIHAEEGPGDAERDVGRTQIEDPHGPVAPGSLNATRNDPDVQEDLPLRAHERAFSHPRDGCIEFGLRAPIR
jgi:hypothetical protein